MLNYAVIGHPVGHTMSPYIHKRLFALSGIDADYQTLDISPDCLGEAFGDKSRSLSGINITIPHKQTIIPLLDRLDESAARYGAVNCVAFGNGTVGYNTDGYGFRKSLERHGIGLHGNVLLLGSGGVARTMAFEAASEGCTITVAARSQSGEKLRSDIADMLGADITAVPFEDISGKFDIVINATPVGMYPLSDRSPIGADVLDGCGALFDAVYNPAETLLMRSAREHGITAVGGMEMLVLQAVRAHEIWYGATFCDKDIDGIIDGAYHEMARLFGKKRSDRLVLCGFMGSGKTTVGKVVAKRLGFAFADTDSLCEQAAGMSIPETFDSLGEAAFRDIEHEVCRQTAGMSGTVIATGGGTLAYERNARLFGDDTVVFLDIPFDEAKRRASEDGGRPLFGDVQKAYSLYRDRLEKYRSVADITVDASGTVSETADAVIKEFGRKHENCQCG